jgi:hypothetical protein
MFSTIGFLAYQILGIVGSQIETKKKKFFSKHTYKPGKISFAIRKF